MILYLDTTAQGHVIFVLQKEVGFVHKCFNLRPGESFLILDKLRRFLTQAKVQSPVRQIEQIIVNKGPGSFVGVRVGVSLAQALVLAWGIPVKFLSAADFPRALKNG